MANGHNIDECKNFLNASGSDKLSNLSSRGVCYIRLRVGHLSRDCTDKICDEIN